MSTLVADNRGEVVSSVEADSVAQLAQAASATAQAALVLAELARAQGQTAEQRADAAIADAQLALQLANDALAESDGNPKLPITGGSLTGFLELHANPISPFHATPKTYVDFQFDTVLANYYPKTEVWTKAESNNLFLTRSAPVVGGGPLTLAEDGSAPLHAVTVQQAEAALASAIPSGVIVMWSGPTDSVPLGWAICDGQNGTPDLRDRFVIGAGGSYTSRELGGSDTHQHTVTVSPHALTLSEMPAHSHPVNDPGHGHSGSTNNTGNHTHFSNGTRTGRDAANPGSNFWASSGDVADFGPKSVTFAGAHEHTLFINDAVTGITLTSQGGGLAHTHGAAADPASTLPPFLALAYIMKL